MNLGKPEISLDVASVKNSQAFYSALGFTAVEGCEDDGWMILEHANGTRLGLYEGHLPDNALSFFGGDVRAVAASLAENGFEMATGPTEEHDGSVGATIRDPDDNLLYFNT
jgi:predicted lactoylglutathione lyase